MMGINLSKYSKPIKISKNINEEDLEKTYPI